MDLRVWMGSILLLACRACGCSPAATTTTLDSATLPAPPTSVSVTTSTAALQPDGTFCENCGRSAVGVAGTGVAADEATIRSRPTVIEFTDGSLVGYGIEGSIGGEVVVDDPFTGSGDSPTQLGYISIPGSECLYNVWSRRSESELLEVIDRLRIVEG